MLFRRDPEPDAPPAPPPPDSSWPTRLAWSFLALSAALLVIRCGFATVVEIHGEGMAPGLLSGDHVVVVRGTWGLSRGDIVVYDPSAPEAESHEAPVPELPGEQLVPDRRPQGRGARDRLRNAAVVDADELGMADEWQAVQARSGVELKAPSRGLRVARILALPGDTVTFGDPRGALGLSINGEALASKVGPALRVVADKQRGSSFEVIGEHRYQVLTSSARSELWPGMHVPGESGPYEMPAEGYLLVADNRDEGACCDSRVLGWIAREQIRGEIILRLGSEERVPRR